VNIGSCGDQQWPQLIFPQRASYADAVLAQVPATVMNAAAASITLFLRANVLVPQASTPTLTQFQASSQVFNGVTFYEVVYKVTELNAAYRVFVGDLASGPISAQPEFAAGPGQTNKDAPKPPQSIVWPSRTNYQDAVLTDVPAAVSQVAETAVILFLQTSGLVSTPTCTPFQASSQVVGGSSFYEVVFKIVELNNQAFRVFVGNLPTGPVAGPPEFAAPPAAA